MRWLDGITDLMDMSLGPASQALGKGDLEDLFSGVVSTELGPVPSLSLQNVGSSAPPAGDLRELPRVPLRGEGSCGGGGATWKQPLRKDLQDPLFPEPGKLGS